MRGHVLSLGRSHGVEKRLLTAQRRKVSNNRRPPISRRTYDHGRAAGVTHGPSVAEQDFVDAAYERLDALRASYRDRQGRIHSTHGVGNAQAWTEREALSAHLGEMAARLEGVEERLVFGRLDMVDASTRHVGRLSLSHEDGTPLLVDWRAPAARPFYQATSAEPEGVVRRRHISTRDRRVTGLEDELLDASHAQGLELQGEGALMHALSEAARRAHG